MLGGNQAHMFSGMLGSFDFMTQAQQMEQQVPSLMQQQYVVRGDMVDALPQMNMIPASMSGLVHTHTPALMMATPAQHAAAVAQQQYVSMRSSTTGAGFTMGVASSAAPSAAGPVRIVRYGDAAGETLSRAERVARYREKRKNRCALCACIFPTWCRLASSCWPAVLPTVHLSRYLSCHVKFDLSACPSVLTSPPLCPTPPCPTGALRRPSATPAARPMPRCAPASRAALQPRPRWRPCALPRLP
jgi:hypothetical protein